MSWYQNTLCKMHFDMHTPEQIEGIGADFCPETYAAQMAEAGAEVVNVFARCGYAFCYFPTRVGTRHPHVTRDLFGETCRALKQRGIRVIAYVAISEPSRQEIERHPHWLARDEHGNPQTFENGQRIVSCGPTFLREFVGDLLCEIVETYDVDGFFLDGHYHFYDDAHCRCENCRTSFGKPMPNENDRSTYAEWRHWLTRSTWSELETICKRVSDIKADCLIGSDWLAGIRWSERPPKAWGYLTGDVVLENGVLETAYKLSAWAWRGMPCDCMNQRMYWWQDLTFRTPETVMSEFAASLAAGATVFLGDVVLPQSAMPDPEAMLLAKESFAFLEGWRELTSPDARLAEIAILSSPEAIRKPNSPWTVDEDPLRGAFLAVLEAGYTVDILFDDDLPEHLGCYTTLILPEQEYIREHAATAIIDFVRKGGSLVIVRDLPKVVTEDGVGDATIWEELVGIRSHERFEHQVTYFRMRGTTIEHFWRQNDSFRPLVAVRGAAANIEAIDADVLATLTMPGECYQFGAFPPGDETDSPAFTRHNYGEGRIIYSALPLASDFWNRGNPGAGYVLAAMTEDVVPEGYRFKREGSPVVQLTVAQKGEHLICHLVHCARDLGPSGTMRVEQPSPTHGVRIRIRNQSALVEVKTVPYGIQPSFERDGDYFLIDVPPFIMHTALMLKFASHDSFFKEQ